MSRDGTTASLRGWSLVVVLVLALAALGGVWVGHHRAG